MIAAYPENDEFIRVKLIVFLIFLDTIDETMLFCLLISAIVVKEGEKIFRDVFRRSK
jgi:hypothetical protein